MTFPNLFLLWGTTSKTNKELRYDICCDHILAQDIGIAWVVTNRCSWCALMFLSHRSSLEIALLQYACFSCSALLCQAKPKGTNFSFKKKGTRTRLTGRIWDVVGSWAPFWWKFRKQFASQLQPDSRRNGGNTSCDGIKRTVSVYLCV